MNIQNKSNVYNLILSLFAIEGIVALFFLGRIPSEGKNARLWGFSSSRLFVAGIIIFLLLFFLITILRAWLQPIWLENHITRLEHFLFSGSRFLYLIVTMAFLIAIGAAFIILFNSSLSIHAVNLTAIYQRFASILIWGILACLQSLALFWYIYPDQWRKPGFFDKSSVARVLIIGSILVLTGLQWAILFTQDALLTSIPGWYWQFHPKTFRLSDILILPLFLILLFFVYLILRKSISPKISLILCLLLGYILQIGFGFVQGQGFESIRQKFIISGHRYYALTASDSPDIFQNLTNYEKTAGSNFILGTKPPGGLLYFMVVQKLSNLFVPVNTFQQRYFRLTSVAAVAFPILAVFAVLVLFYINPLFLPIKDELIIPGLLFILCPNFILMPLQFDQFLYPLFFLAGFQLSLIAIRRQSPWIAFLTGIFLYLAVYFSFSLIPLTFFVGLWILVDTYYNRKVRQKTALLKMMGAIGLGILVTAALLYYFLNFDVVLRYNNAFIWHRSLKLYQPGIGQILNALLVNNLEFTFWTGSPIIVLLIYRIFKTAQTFYRKKALPSDWLLVISLALYIVLNVAGQTRSEVGRLWLFLVPLIMVLITPVIKNIFKNTKSGVYFIIILQFITTFIMFIYQDFY